jgi:outer membrane protein TolC
MKRAGAPGGTTRHWPPRTNQSAVQLGVRHGLCAAALLGMLGGCSFYRALPLNATTVDKALQPPPIELVKIAAAALDHPLIKPMIIDGDGGFTPDEIAVIAVIVSPQLRAVRDQRGLAQAQVVQAGILPNPQWSQSADFPHGNTDPTLVTGRTLGIGWDVSALLTHHDDVAAARANAKSVDLQIAWQEWQVAQDARLRAFRIASRQERLPLAREIEEGLASNVAAVRQAFALGHKLTADLTTATDLYTQARDSRLALEQSLIADRLALNLAMALAADAPLTIKAPETFPALEADAKVGSELLAGIETHRLDLVALTLGYKSQESALRSAILSQFPKINLSVNKAKDTGNVQSRGWAVGVEIPLFDRRQGVIASAKATRQQLFDDYAVRVAEARSMVRQILEDLAVTRAQLKSASESLADLQYLADGYGKAFAGRNADVIAYRDARAALATRRIEQSKLKQDLLELGVGLEIATGRALLSSTITR